MKNFKFANIAVFIIFFGAALMEALQKHNWFLAIIFLFLGIISFWVDLRKK